MRHLLFAGVPLALLAACASAPPPVEQVVQCTPPDAARPAPAGPALVNQDYGTAITPIPLNAVLFNDDGIARSVSVQALYSSRTAGGTVEVSARLVSCLDRPAMVRLRTTFMSKNAAPVEPPSAWHPVALSPRATALYAERSIARDEVGAFLVEIAPLP